MNITKTNMIKKTTIVKGEEKQRISKITKMLILIILILTNKNLYSLCINQLGKNPIINQTKFNDIFIFYYFIN